MIEEDHDRTANLLGALALALTDRMTDRIEACAEYGAAAPAALVSIGIDPGLSVGALARTIGLSHSATVRIADRLAGDGLVERRKGADGRVVGLHLTRRGMARRQTILDGRGATLSRALTALSEGQRAQLTALLETLLGTITEDRKQADRTCRLCHEEVCPETRCPVENAAIRSEARP